MLYGAFINEKLCEFLIEKGENNPLNILVKLYHFLYDNL